MEDNILASGRDGQKDKKCKVPPDSNTFGRLPFTVNSEFIFPALLTRVVFVQFRCFRRGAQHDDCPPNGTRVSKKEMRGRVNS